MTRPAPSPSRAPRTRVLSIHADYHCENTGACCSSGWDIPVDPGTENTLRAALREGALHSPGGEPFRSVPDLTHGARVVLGVDEAGRCAFLEPERGNLCRVHRQLGPGALASACRDFPRVVTLTPGGFSITLSHYCPTAAARLFRDGPPLTIEVDPPAFPPDGPYEGLDARESVGPFLRPGVMLGWDAHARWEAHAVAILARDDLEPEEALALLAASAEAARAWTPAHGALGAHLERCLAETEVPQAAVGLAPGECDGAWRFLAGCVPHGHPLPPPPDWSLREPGGAWSHGERWGPWGAPVRRWLAGRAFASWLAQQGDGLRTTVRGLRLALGVLGAETGRGGARSGPAVERARILEAFRRADLLLVHLADPVLLARRLSRCEAAAGPPIGTW